MNYRNHLRLLILLSFCGLVISQASQRDDFETALSGVRIEYAVDLFIRALDSHVLQRGSEVRLIRTLYGRTAEGIVDAPRMIVPSRTAAEPPYTFELVAMRQFSDRLSMRLRLLRRWNALEPREAKAMAAELLSIGVSRRATGCSEMMVNTAGEFYPILTGILGRTAVVRAPVRSVAQLAALVDFMNAQPQSTGPAEVEQVMDALKALTGSDREFATAQVRLLLGIKLKGLLSHLAVPQSTARAIVVAYRQFLVRHLKGTRCSDWWDGAGVDVLPDMLGQFNDLASKYEVPRLTPHETTPMRIQEAPLYFKPVVGQRNKERVAMVQQFVMRGSPEDRQEVQSMLDTIGSQPAVAGCEICSYIARIGTLMLVLQELAPSAEDPLVGRAISTMLRLITESPLYERSPEIWLLTCKQLVNLLRHPNGEFRSRLQRAMLQSGNPTLALYANRASISGGEAYDPAFLRKFNRFEPAF